MQWRGRRQSTNVLDMRTYPKSIILMWWGEEQDADTTRDPNEFLVDTDGLFYFMGQSNWTKSEVVQPNANYELIGQQMDASYIGGMEELKLAFIPPHPKPRAISLFNRPWSPTLSSGQKYALKMLIKKMLEFTDKSQITIHGQRLDGETYLMEYAQSILNNN